MHASFAVLFGLLGSALAAPHGNPHLYPPYPHSTEAVLHGRACFSPFILSGHGLGHGPALDPKCTRVSSSLSSTWSHWPDHPTAPFGHDTAWPSDYYFSKSTVTAPTPWPTVRGPHHSHYHTNHPRTPPKVLPTEGWLAKTSVRYLWWPAETIHPYPTAGHIVLERDTIESTSKTMTKRGHTGPIPTSPPLPTGPVPLLDPLPVPVNNIPQDHPADNPGIPYSSYKCRRVNEQREAMARKLCEAESANLLDHLDYCLNVHGTYKDPYSPLDCSEYQDVVGQDQEEVAEPVPEDALELDPQANTPDQGESHT